jgi:mRNA degradation ribonuclease J1/J2
MVGLTPSQMDDQRTVTEVRPGQVFHASGHAGQPELVDFVRRARPEVLVPINTDAAHLWISLLEGTGVKVVLPEYARPLEVG